MRILTIFFLGALLASAGKADEIIPWEDFRENIERQAEHLPDYQYRQGRDFLLGALEQVRDAKALIEDCIYAEERPECVSQGNLRVESIEYGSGYYMLEYLADLTEAEQPPCGPLRHDIKFYSNYKPNLPNHNADFVLGLAEKICRLESAWPLDRTLSTMRPAFLSIEFAGRTSGDGYVFPEVLTTEFIEAARAGDEEALSLIEGMQKNERFGEVIAQLSLKQVGPDSFLQTLDALERIDSAAIWREAMEDLGRHHEFSAGGFEVTYLQHYKPDDPDLIIRFAFLLAWLEGSSGFWADWMVRLLTEGGEAYSEELEVLSGVLASYEPIFRLLNKWQLSEELTDRVLRMVPIARVEESLQLSAPSSLDGRLVSMIAEVSIERGIHLPDQWASAVDGQRGGLTEPHDAGATHNERERDVELVRPAPACPDIYALDDWPEAFHYIPLPTAERLNDALSDGVPACFEELVLFARAGKPEGQAMLERLGDDAASQALRFLIVTPVAEMDAVALVRHMVDAGEPVLWEAAFLALGSGLLQAEDAASRRALADLVPRDPATALTYASVMDDVTGEESHWAGVTSSIIMDSPEVLVDDGFWDFRLSPDMARLDDWMDGLSPDELALFVERLDVEKRLELPGFVEPDQLTIVTFAGLLSEFYDQSVEPPQAWVAYFEDNLADWMLTHLPEELLKADVWDRSHDDLLRDPGEVVNALGQVFSAMGPLQVFPYLGVLAETESPVLVRIAYGIRMMIVPSHAHFLDLVDSGVSPSLLADALDRNQIQTVVMTGLNSERPEALFELIKHLDCHHFDDTSRMLAEFRPASSQPQDGSVFDAWLARAGNCE